MTGKCFLVRSCFVHLPEIKLDISRAKRDWKHSVYKTNSRPPLHSHSHSCSENDRSDSENEKERGKHNDLILSLLNRRYSKIIDTEVQKLLNGESTLSLTTVAKTCAENIYDGGGKCYKVPFAQSRTEVQNINEAAESEPKRLFVRTFFFTNLMSLCCVLSEIEKDLRRKLASGRECHSRIVIVNMGNGKYKDRIMAGANALARESDKSSGKVAEISKGVLQDFKRSGAKQFFKSCKAEEEMSVKEALSSKFVRWLYSHCTVPLPLVTQ